MKDLKLGAQLNISFALVLFVPMIIATVFSIVYYSNKIEQEAVNTISSDLKTADIIYQNSVIEMKNLAKSYAQKDSMKLLLMYNLGERIGDDLAKSARFDDLDMITIVDSSYKVLVRSHAPQKTGDAFPQKDYVNTAISGLSISKTESVTTEELKQEGFAVDSKLFPHISKFLVITGISPVYDRQGKIIMGAIIVRRILSSKSAIVHKISKNLNVSSALFEQTHLIVSATATAETDEFILPPSKLLENVLKQNIAMHTANISKGGSISKCLPISDFNGKPVGVLMVQRGVNTYLRTRNIAIITLLAIFLTGLILAFTIKTIIERRIVIPVQRLRQGAEHIGNREYDYRLDVTSKDEIGELTEAFNIMTKDLYEYDRQLKEYNLQLEERVKERTAELQIANEQLIRTNTVLEDTLERLNPGVSRLIGNNKQQLGLVYATELVADVCTYTKLNMILGETMMGEFMKMFFRESHKLLAQYRGMFDKTVGDQIVAIFGTPKDDSPASLIHPFDAIACALKLVEAANQINSAMQVAIQDNYNAVAARHKSLSREDRESIKIEDLRFQCRIGINTSNPASDREIDRMRMVMMGAETYADYTAQGGAVIYAFRLESNGIPGKIHIGENTKRLVEHVYVLEELPSITLKGLGVQSGYRVTGHQSVFDTIYPKTRFYQKYCNNVPKELINLINTLKIGRIQLKEVRKINEYLHVDIPYLEHFAGFYNLAMARTIFSYAVGESAGLNETQLHAMMFACLWHNAIMLRNIALESLDFFPVQEQIPDFIDTELAETIIADLANPKQIRPESGIIALCNYFDYKVFDRSCLKNRGQEIISVKKVISQIKSNSGFDPRLTDALADLMIAPETAEQKTDHLYADETLILPKNPELLARAIEKNLSSEQRNELISMLQG